MGLPSGRTGCSAHSFGCEPVEFCVKWVRSTPAPAFRRYLRRTVRNSRAVGRWGRHESPHDRYGGRGGLWPSCFRSRLLRTPRAAPAPYRAMQSLPMQSPVMAGFLMDLPEPVRRSIRGRFQRDLRRGVPGPAFCPISTCRAVAGKSAGPAEGFGSVFTGSAGSALRTVARCGPELTSPRVSNSDLCHDRRACRMGAQLLPQYDG